MAIDTAEKRRAVAQVGFYWGGPGVTPNASKDVEWRQEAGWGYSGIAPASPVVSTGASHLLLLRAASIGWVVGVLRYG